MRKAGCVRGTRITRRCRFTADWRAAIFPNQLTQVYLDGEVFEDGGVAISVGGDVTLAGVISQGCTPIGETWTLTRVEQNLIHQIGNRPAYAVLAETVSQTFARRPAKSARTICSSAWSSTNISRSFIAAIFSCATCIGGDPNSGVLAVGALPRAGQTIQFQRRDAAAADRGHE